MRNFVTSFLRDDSGASAAEYALILAMAVKCRKLWFALKANWLKPTLLQVRRLASHRIDRRMWIPAVAFVTAGYLLMSSSIDCDAIT
jgi:hypothetical protein